MFRRRREIRQFIKEPVRVRRETGQCWPNKGAEKCNEEDNSRQLNNRINPSSAGRIIYTKERRRKESMCNMAVEPYCHMCTNMWQELASVLQSINRVICHFQPTQVGSTSIFEN